MAFDLTQALVDVPNNIFNIISWLVVIISALLIIAIAVYHIISSNKHDKISIKKIKEKPSLYLSFILIFISVIYGIIIIHMTKAETFSMYSIECEIPRWTFSLSYTSFKSVLYIILVARVWKLFKGKSFVKFSRKWLQVWMWFILLFFIEINVINVITTKTTFKNNNHCEYKWSILFIGSIAIMDVAAMVIYIYLFVRPIIMINNRNRRLSDADNIDMRYLVIKQCILSLFAVISTIITAIFVIIFHMTQVFVSFDVIISSISVILMYKWNERLFEFFCYFCLKCTKGRYLSKDVRELTVNKYVIDTENGDKKEEFEDVQHLTILASMRPTSSNQSVATNSSVEPSPIEILTIDNPSTMEPSPIQPSPIEMSPIEKSAV